MILVTCFDYDTQCVNAINIAVFSSLIAFGQVGTLSINTVNYILSINTVNYILQGDETCSQS